MIKKKKEKKTITSPFVGGGAFPRDSPDQSSRKLRLRFEFWTVGAGSPRVTALGWNAEGLHWTIQGLLTENGVKKYDDMDLDSMKYAELRSLAKDLGLKANMKVGFPPLLYQGS